MKNFLNCFTVFLCLFATSLYSQMGVGTSTPRGILDLNSPLSSTMGLVLPTNSLVSNIINPQGDSVVEGTMMYDSTEKCVKFYNGSNWSNCLCDTCGNSNAGITPPSAIQVNCLGFAGDFRSTVPLSGASYRVSITNNSLSPIGPFTLQTSDLAINGVNGITVSSVSPTSLTVNPGQTRVITYNLNGTPFKDGTLTATWSKLGLNCSNTKEIYKVVRFAYWGWGIGNAFYANFNSQLQNSKNYGANGTYSGEFSGFRFTDISSTLNSYSAKDLLERFDVISIGPSNMQSHNAAKIKSFVDGGGVALMLVTGDPNKVRSEIFHVFGGNGHFSSAILNENAKVNNNIVNNGVFGNSTNAIIKGFHSFANIQPHQLPKDHIIFASLNNLPRVFAIGKENRAIFFYDNDLFKNSSIQDNIINTPQEIFLHNMMAYALKKRGL